jgi:hypothetical protein
MLLAASAAFFAAGAAAIAEAPRSMLGWFVAAAGIAGTVFYVWLTRRRR